jgi:hypothetical protein
MGVRLEADKAIFPRLLLRWRRHSCLPVGRTSKSGDDVELARTR